MLDHTASPETNTTEAAPDLAAQATAPQLDPAQLQKLAEDEMRFALTFTRILSLMARALHYRQYTFADIEWLLVPPLMAGQCAVIEATAPNGQEIPVAAALWAFVSPKVDQRLSQNLDLPIRLTPQEWQSGHVAWLIDAVGEPSGIAVLLEQLRKSVLSGRDVKYRTKHTDGSSLVRLLTD